MQFHQPLATPNFRSLQYVLCTQTNIPAPVHVYVHRGVRNQFEILWLATEIFNELFDILKSEIPNSRK